MPKEGKTIAVYLTPEQIREAYRRLLEQEHADWFYEPQVAEELLQRGAEMKREVKAGKAADWEDFRKELGV